MKDKNKLEQRRHHTNDDGTKNRKRTNRHKHVSQLKKDQQLSRDKRREAKAKVRDLHQAQNCINEFKIYIVLDETDNNEKILLQKSLLNDGGYSLELPTISQDVVMIENVLNYNESYDIATLDDAKESLLRFINERFGIQARFLDIIADKKLIIIKDVVHNNSYLQAMVIRTTNQSTWLDGNVYASLEHTPFYRGENTDTYLASEEDLGDVVISGNLLNNVLDYRIYFGKIKHYYGDYGKTSDYLWTFLDSDQMDILRKEESELKLLLFKGKDGTIHQDINKFLRFEPTFEKYCEKLQQEASERGIMSYLHAPLSDTYREFMQVSSEYFSRKRKK